MADDWPLFIDELRNIKPICGTLSGWSVIRFTTDGSEVFVGIPVKR